MSTEISSKIKGLADPVAQRHGIYKAQALVLEAVERTNTCKVQYTRRDGTKEVAENVQVLLSNSGMIDWFPSEKDIVLVQDRDGTIFIEGPAYDNYDEIRKKIMPERDILADTFGSFFAGSVF